MLFLILLFIVVPIAEIYVIIQVGQVIGPLPTLALLIIESLIGAWLLKREGRAAWAALQKVAQAEDHRTERREADVLVEHVPADVVEVRLVARRVDLERDVAAAVIAPGARIPRRKLRAPVRKELNLDGRGRWPPRPFRPFRAARWRRFGLRAVMSLPCQMSSSILEPTHSARPAA
jgi:hypothetical protein